MEEKTIVITEKAENQILGQESVFGWQMKDKKEAGKFLFLKYNQYTLVRDRNPEDVTQAHIDVENRWENEFKTWNNFVLNGMKKYFLINFIGIALLFVGFIVMLVGMGTIDPYADSLPASLIIGFVMVLLSLAFSIPALVFVMKNGTGRLKKMDEISRDMRQVNAIRNNK